MVMANPFIPGLNPQYPHYLPGYTGHCPLLRFSMGQTYGQVTSQLRRGAPGLAWPPAQRTLLPPIQPPRSRELPGGSLPPRCGHERLSSSMVPGYTGFVPQAQFIFAKNCNQVWDEALHTFTQWHGRQKNHELSKEASPYSMDDRDPQKFFMSGFTGYVPRARFLFGSSFPVLTNQALQEFGQKYSRGSTPKDPKHLPAIPRPKLNVFHAAGYMTEVLGHIFGHLTHDALGLSTSQKQ
uniref:Ciliary microtubule inner protein 2B n=1 Tax=Jaculus jaculus TaxID=51337 RepID=A0A8C5L1M0_JACJA